MVLQERHVPAVVATLLLAGTLLAVLALHLLLPLLAGLTAYTVHGALLRAVAARGLGARRRHVAAMVLFWLILIAVGGAVVEGLERLGLGTPHDTLVRLTALLATSLDRLHAMLPTWLAQHLPDSITSLRDEAVGWLRTHATDLRLWGTETLRALAYVLIGLVIGLLASVHRGDSAAPAPAFLTAWRDGLARLAQAFSNVMGAQLRIAAVNTVLTGLYVLVVAPAVAEPIPLAGMLVVLTFVVGLVPVLGNLVSNSALVLASLLVSPVQAIVSLAYLAAIHKLEYFLNARLVGGRINARTYELLAAMLLLESVFGIKGVVAAPIYYAWMMGVLKDEGWV